MHQDQFGLLLAYLDKSLLQGRPKRLNSDHRVNYDPNHSLSI